MTVSIKKKIILTIPTLRKAGAERVVSLLSQGFEKSGYDVTVVVYGGPVEYQCGGRLLSLGIPQHMPRLFRKITNSILPAIRLRRLFKRECPDTIISFLDVVAPILTGYPITLSLHTHYERLSFLDRFLLKRLAVFPHVQRIIVPSKGLQKSIKMQTKFDRVYAIPNPIDIVSIDKALPDTPLGQHTPFAVAVGRLEKIKRFDYLIEAFAKLSTVDLDLLILGTGPHRKLLEIAIARLGLQNKIRLAGSVESPYGYMKAAQFLVMTSRMETFGNALVEALGCGTPIISVDCDFGPREIVRDGENGFLVPLDDQEALVRAMKELTVHHELRNRFSEACRRDASIYDLARIVPLWEKEVLV